MRLAMDRLGSRLRSLPDGETGERRDWILHIVEGFRSHPDLELARDGDWSGYDRTPRFRLRAGHRLFGANLDFGHVPEAKRSWAVFQRIRQQFGRPDLTFQVGVPGDLDLAMFTFGPAAGLRHRRAFTEATVAELRRVHAVCGAEVVFQVEVPVELSLLARLPRPAQPSAARLLAKGIIDLAVAAPHGARFGVHLCLGDLNHRPFGTMTDVAPLVHLTNALVTRWPADRPLEFLHAPFAAADQPPPLDPAFYAPLARLRLPARVRFIAGFVHEDRSLDQQRQVRALLDRHLGRAVDLAAACGLGRRDPAAANATLEQTAALTAD
jgi:hypothetical protein